MDAGKSTSKPWWNSAARVRLIAQCARMDAVSVAMVAMDVVTAMKVGNKGGRGGAPEKPEETACTTEEVRWRRLQI